MPLSAGSRLGSYEVKFTLGVGGMGEVYCARDMKLDRDVALKVLPWSLADDAERLGRFEREAKLLASLSHPNIAQLYHIEESPPTAPGQAPTRALVMELVNGPTLSERIRQGPLPLDEAIAIARQIAEALEMAHERGIIHRDLKPANVKLTGDGVVKVLDFGLAKALNPLVDLLDSAAIHTPSFAKPVTESGMVLGTAAYMAPEQARGMPVDQRADIWALGVVLYEMLAGRRPFQGETTSDTLAAVLRQDVEYSQLPRETPDEVRRLIRRCLQRDPKNRLRDAADARLILADVEHERRTGGRSVGRWADRALWLLAGAAAVALASFALSAGRRVPEAASGSNASGSVVRFSIEPPPEVSNVTSVAVAADGRVAVYEAQVEGEYRFFIRRFDELTSRAVPGTEGARGPFLSPDGRWIGFVRNATLFKISTAGGDALAVTTLQGGAGSTWLPDGRIVFARAFLAGLSSVSAEGGAATVLTEPDASREEIGHWWPAALPDGRVLFTIARAATGLNDARIALLDTNTGAYRALLPGAKATWLPSGHIVFFRTGRYHAVRFDLASGNVTGEPFTVLDDAQELDPAGDWPQPVSVVPSGVLAYLPGRYVPPSRLTWIGRDGTLTPLAFPPRPFIGVKLSPDGQRVAAATLEAGRLQIRLFDLERGTEELPRIDGMNWNPVWLPDGRLSYTSMRKGNFDIYVKDVAGTGAEEAVLAGPDDTDPIAWTRDGRLVFQGSEPDGAYPLKLVDLKQPERVTRLTELHVDNGGSLSPDERWLAYQSAAIGRSVVYVRRIGAPGPGIALSRDSGEFPLFLRDGKTLALARGAQLVVRSWRDNAGHFEIGPERVVAPLAFGSGWIYSTPYDEAKGGRFLAIVRTDPPEPPRIRVVLGWDQELGRLASPGRP